MPILDFNSVRVVNPANALGIDITEIRVVNPDNPAPGLSVWSSVALRVFEGTTEYTLKDVVFTTNIGETLTISTSGSVTYSGEGEWTTLAVDGILCNISTPGVLTPRVDATDSVAVLTHIVGLDPIDIYTYKWYAADVNNDGSTTASDATSILQQVTSITGPITPPEPTLMIKEISGSYYVVVRGDVNSSSTWAIANKGVL